MSTSKSSSRNELIIGAILLLVLVVTRSGITRSHFGTTLNLPDASWAIFLLTGAFTTKRWWPALLMLASVIIDYVVIAGGVSAYCFTPAYPFLIPAYLSLWAAGRWLQSTTRKGTYWIYASVALIIGTLACFLISNIGFYLASGYFAKMAVLAYSQAVMRYLPHYLMTTAMYVAVGMIIKLIVTTALRTEQHSTK